MFDSAPHYHLNMNTRSYPQGLDSFVGKCVGFLVGSFVGGKSVGNNVGNFVGSLVGSFVGGTSVNKIERNKC